MKKYQTAFTAFAFILVLAAVFFALSCKKDVWLPGTPLPKERLKIGVIHISDPFSEGSGFAYAHQLGIEEMKRALELTDGQVLYKIHISDSDLLGTESAMRELMAQGVNTIIATAEGYAAISEKLADEYPNVVFTQMYAGSHNGANLTNYFGRVYQARYLSGMVAGLRTETNKIGFVTAWGKENSQITSGLNAFAMGVEKVNPEAKIQVKITYSWFDPMGEAMAARSLIADGCDVIAQHCDTPYPQIEAEKEKVWGIGYNTDMSIDAPDAVLTSVLWHWGVYYTVFVQSIIDGSFTTAPWFGSIYDGIVGISPLNRNIIWEIDTLRTLEKELDLTESGTLDVFSGILETNDGQIVGETGKTLPDEVILGSINWYYRNIIEQ